ncbi:MAG: hypothetical protein EOS07_09780 [Mesorhizobium sp.]|nr:MAG: hypothetical protein EOS07_09780 [Mesorhizobium sp.]
MHRHRLAQSHRFHLPGFLTRTFQSLNDAKMTVTAHCHHAPCHHRDTLDLVKLRDRFGPDAPSRGKGRALE